MTATPSPHGKWVLARGPVFDQPGLAKRVLEAVFSDLIDVDDIGRSALDELRHVSEATLRGVGIEPPAAARLNGPRGKLS
ncbi:hypothetical protein H8Z59_12895 [Mycolicibacterium fortuitum]|uniref:hypothetical protein n=1 Tax=Mycolicibacterium fortuitum TaxID=1766 RepID=UPI001CDB7C5C|nr:hypothetical protein [Mycolicibacterium fortuitum]UBV23940.1 hypothetical protein H8Z59_12895 [Mycolicibacterium fortuitum]